MEITNQIPKDCNELFVQQGVLLDTKRTRKWSENDKIQGQYEEARRVFIRMGAYDEGKSRELVAIYDTPKQAAEAVYKHNAFVLENKDKIWAQK